MASEFGTIIVQGEISEKCDIYMKILDHDVKMAIQEKQGAESVKLTALYQSPMVRTNRLTASKRVGFKVAAHHDWKELEKIVERAGSKCANEKCWIVHLDQDLDLTDDIEEVVVRAITKPSIHDIRRFMRTACELRAHKPSASWIVDMDHVEINDSCACVIAINENLAVFANMKNGGAPIPTEVLGALVMKCIDENVKVLFNVHHVDFPKQKTQVFHAVYDEKGVINGESDEFNEIMTECMQIQFEVCKKDGSKLDYGGKGLVLDTDCSCTFVYRVMHSSKQIYDFICNMRCILGLCKPVYGRF